MSSNKKFIAFLESISSITDRKTMGMITSAYATFCESTDTVSNNADLVLNTVDDVLEKIAMASGEMLGMKQKDSFRLLEEKNFFNRGMNNPVTQSAIEAIYDLFYQTVNQLQEIEEPVQEEPIQEEPLVEEPIETTPPAPPINQTPPPLAPPQQPI